MQSLNLEPEDYDVFLDGCGHETNVRDTLRQLPKIRANRASRLNKLCGATSIELTDMLNTGRTRPDAAESAGQGQGNIRSCTRNTNC